MTKQQRKINGQKRIGKKEMYMNPIEMKKVRWAMILYLFLFLTSHWRNPRGFLWWLPPCRRATLSW